jgi:type IV pilus assembly protein PilX
MTLIGVTAMQGTTQQESMAGNARQRNLAFQAAEAALRAGEFVLQGATLPTFTNTGAQLGLRQPVIPTTDVGTFWLDTYCWVLRTGCTNAESQAYGGTLSEISAPPRYVIEELPRVTLPGGSVKFGALPDVGFYRVTARSLGGVADAVVILQSTYRR